MSAKFLVRLRWQVPYYLQRVPTKHGTEFEWVDKKSATRFSEDEAKKLVCEHNALAEPDR